MRRLIPAAAMVVALGGLCLVTACARVQVEPVEIKPIHITVDINLKIDRALDDFFDSRPGSAEPAGSATPAASATAAGTAR